MGVLSKKARIFWERHILSRSIRHHSPSKSKLHLTCNIYSAIFNSASQPAVPFALVGSLRKYWGTEGNWWGEEDERRRRRVMSFVSPLSPQWLGEWLTVDKVCECYCSLAPPSLEDNCGWCLQQVNMDTAPHLGFEEQHHHIINTAG